MVTSRGVGAMVDWARPEKNTIQYIEDDPDSWSVPSILHCVTHYKHLW